jgi:hypothetical protein
LRHSTTDPKLSKKVSISPQVEIQTFFKYSSPAELRTATTPLRPKLLKSRTVPEFTEKKKVLLPSILYGRTEEEPKEDIERGF